VSITFGDAKILLAEFAARGGLCPDDPRVDLFVKSILQTLLFKGPNDCIRTFCFQARRGMITLPYELETPIKVLINNESGGTWSKWFSYYDTGHQDDRCILAGNALREDPNPYPTIYDLPAGGSRVAVMGVCDEAEDAHLIVRGKDPTGREIVTFQDGEQVVGEYLSIKKGQLRYTTVNFATITEVVKTKTAGYVQLYGYNPDTYLRYFLADYSPLEEIPRYRRFQLTVECRENAEVKVIGRIRLKENYGDSEVLPIGNIYALKTAAQGMNLNDNNDIQGAIVKDQFAEKLLMQENQYKKVGSGQTIDVARVTSGGTIKNIMSPRSGFRRGRIW